MRKHREGSHRASPTVYANHLTEMYTGLQAVAAGDGATAARIADYMCDAAGHGLDDVCDAHILAIAAGQAETLAQHAAGASPMPPAVDRDHLAEAYATRSNFGQLVTAAINHAENVTGTYHRSFLMRWDTFGISFTIDSASDLTGAWALQLVGEGDFDQARRLLDTADYTSAVTHAARIELYLATKRWGDVIDAVQHTTGDQSLSDPILYACAQAALGLALASLDNRDPAIAAFDAAEACTVPTIAAWAALNHGLYMRTLGDDTAAAKLLSASMTTSYTPQAENAQSHPDVKLRTTSRAMIATRTDFWDPLTEDDPEIERARDDKSRREGYLERANALLDRKIGMTEVKDHLHSLANLAKVNEEMERRGLTTAPQNWNQQFLGPPGTGKSTIVKAYTLFLAAYGIVDDPEPKIVSAEDLTDGTVGGTAPKTKEVVAGAKGKVLFIDEFYALLPDETNRTGANSAGVEAINTLVNLMEPLIGTTVFVFAGYPWEMARVINVNPGMPRRVPNVVNFASFTLDQFSKVTAIEAETAGLVIADDAMDWLADEHGPMRMVHERPAGVGDTVMDNLGNGGFARNLVQKANLRRASRLAASDMSVLDQDAMRTLTLDDIAPVAEKEIHDAMHGTAASR